MNKTKIEWCDYTINPIVGCSNGCYYCYARKINNRFNNTLFEIPIYYPERLLQIDKIKDPSRIFLGSMCDLFDRKIKDEWRNEIFDKISNTKHIYMILTKQIENFINYDKKNISNNNIWFGITITGKEDWTLENISSLFRFVSIEPFLEKLNDDLLQIVSQMEWIIVGGLTGYNEYKLNPKWVYNILDICNEFKIPFFFKGRGGNMKKDDPYYYKIDGIEWRQFPEELKL